MVSSHSSLAAVVIARNEEAMIVNCLETLRWCDEVIVVDDSSSDTTAQLAQRWGARVIKGEGSFPDLRNAGMAATKADWIFYVDADERVVPALAAEISSVIDVTKDAALAVTRRNILYGHHLRHGGWAEDSVVRLFRRDQLEKWAGEVHEHAEVHGSTGSLKTQLWHLTHRNVLEGLAKTIDWTPVEAALLADAKVPPITALTLIRKFVMEVFRRAVLKKGYLDGTAGWVEALIQGANRLIVYAQVWELQQTPSLPQRYQEVEEKVAQAWKKTEKVA